MVYTKGKDILSSDLDIFGEGDETEQETTNDQFDIFGGANEAEESPEEEATETPEEEATETTEDSPTDKVETTEGTESEEDEELPIDIENLFSDLDSAKSDSEKESIIDALRTEVTTISTERNILQKENSILNEKLMSKVGDESNLGIYKGVISNLEENPKLMMLVKYAGKTDSEAIKSKLLNVLGDMIYDITGEDVSDLINKNQSDKILAATGKTGSSSMPEPKEEEDNDNMDYEESLSRLF